MPPLFRIKICGITRAVDAMAASRAGADAIGLNFCTSSPRFVDDATAGDIVAAVPPELQKVGVFVNEPLDPLLRRVHLLGLDWVQLHGDEPPERIGQIADVGVIRAFRCRDQQLQPVADYLNRCRAAGHPPRAVLLDAWQAERYGGTGETLDWGALRAEISRLGNVPWILAGGLRADNVAQAVRVLGPWAVDTASGVESAPGIKSELEMTRFVAAARAAMQTE